MGLYLCIFDEEENELEGVEIGSYDDFGRFRDQVEELGTDAAFPTLLEHSDCDGQWTVEECDALDRELEVIEREFRARRPFQFEPESWQAKIAKTLGLRPADLYESFYDIDGEPLIARLRQLIDCARSSGHPILFQ